MAAKTEREVKINDRRRGIIFHPTFGYAIPPPIAPTVARRNARERSRVKTVNESYQALKARVPAAANAKRMAKVDIIKHTIEYIQKLQTLVNSIEESQVELHKEDTRVSGFDFLNHYPSIDNVLGGCSSYSPSSDSGYGSPMNVEEDTTKQLTEKSQHQTELIHNNYVEEDSPKLTLLSDQVLLDAIAEWQDS